MAYRLSNSICLCWPMMFVMISALHSQLWQTSCFPNYRCRCRIQILTRWSLSAFSTYFIWPRELLFRLKCFIKSEKKKLRKSPLSSNIVWAPNLTQESVCHLPWNSSTLCSHICSYALISVCFSIFELLFEDFGNSLDSLLSQLSIHGKMLCKHTISGKKNPQKQSKQKQIQSERWFMAQRKLILQKAGLYVFLEKLKRQLYSL